MTLILFSWILCIINIVYSKSINYTLSIDTNSIITTIPVPYYGFQFDWWTKAEWTNAQILTINLSNPNLIAYTKAVSPAYLRIGGSPQDGIIYDIDGACSNVNASLPGYGCCDAGNNYGCMTTERWQQILSFTIKTNISLLFGLNACYGRKSHSSSLNFSNINALLNYTANQLSVDLIQNIYAFEFGEEVETRIDADIYAQDFYKIKQTINKYWRNNDIQSIPYMMGGDVPMSSQSVPWSTQVVTNLSVLTNNNTSSVLHKVTYHHYPNCAYNSSADSVFSLKCLQSIKNYAGHYVTLGDTVNITAVMGEGSEHNGGGTVNVSNTFVDCFYYLYQLCDLLINNVSGTVRSDLVGGHYQLIDNQTFIANPSYWILYLFKQFIGDRMYESNLTNNNSNFRAYSFSMSNKENDLVIAIINFDMKNNAQMEIIVDNKQNNYEYNEYHLTPIGEGGLQTINIAVNGVKMEYKNGMFPTLTPKKGNGIVQLNPATIAFITMTPIQ